MKSFKARPAGLIFDLDGTLVDSRLDFAGMRREIGCPVGTGLLEFIAGREDTTERRAAEAVVHRHEMAGAANATWMPGARELLTALHRHRVPLGIVTRNSRPAAELTLRSLSAPALDLVTREDARPKPDPDGLLQLARRWQLSPSRLAYVGDFRFDLEAAAAAGMVSVLYLQDRNREFAPGADHVIGHFEELRAWLPDAPGGEAPGA